MMAMLRICCMTGSRSRGRSAEYRRAALKINLRVSILPRAKQNRPAFPPARPCNSNPTYFLEIVTGRGPAQRRWQPESLHRLASRMVRIDIHIDADGVIRYNRER